MVVIMIRRSKSQWRELVTKQQSSGLNATEFCRRNTINAKYFSARKRQLDNGGNPFVQITPPVVSRVGPATKLIKLRVIELDLPQEAMIESLALLLNAERQ